MMPKLMQYRYEFNDYKEFFKERTLDELLKTYHFFASKQKIGTKVFWLEW